MSVHQECRLLFDQGNRHFTNGNYTNALLSFTSAIEMGAPGQAGIDLTAKSYSARAAVHFYLHNQDKGLSDCNSAIDLAPDHANFYNVRGTNFFSIGQFEKALSDFKAAIDLDPEDPRYFNNRGSTHRRMKNFRLAIEDYSQAMKLAPTNASFVSNRGHTYADMGDYQSAISDFQKSLTLDDDPDPKTNASLLRVQRMLADELKDATEVSYTGVYLQDKKKKASEPLKVRESTFTVTKTGISCRFEKKKWGKMQHMVFTFPWSDEMRVDPIGKDKLRIRLSESSREYIDIRNCDSYAVEDELIWRINRLFPAYETTCLISQQDLVCNEYTDVLRIVEERKVEIASLKKVAEAARLQKVAFTMQDKFDEAQLAKEQNDNVLRQIAVKEALAAEELIRAEHTRSGAHRQALTVVKLVERQRQRMHEAFLMMAMGDITPEAKQRLKQQLSTMKRHLRHAQLMADLVSRPILELQETFRRANGSTLKHDIKEERNSALLALATGQGVTTVNPEEVDSDDDGIIPPPPPPESDEEDEEEEQKRIQELRISKSGRVRSRRSKSRGRRRRPPPAPKRPGSDSQSRDPRGRVSVEPPEMPFDQEEEQWDDIDEDALDGSGASRYDPDDSRLDFSYDHSSQDPDHSTEYTEFSDTYSFMSVQDNEVQFSTGRRQSLAKVEEEEAKKREAAEKLAEQQQQAREAARQREQKEAEEMAELRRQMRVMQEGLHQANAEKEAKAHALAVSKSEQQRAEEEIEKLKEQAMQEELKRRQMHNLIEEIKGNIRVYVRIRPRMDGLETGSVHEEAHPDSADEEDKVEESVADPHSNRGLFEAVPFSDGRGLRVVGETKHKISSRRVTAKTWDFEFDRIFWPSTTQTGVFSEIKGLVTSALDGYKVSIFAYGQTGSGKSYTMEGPGLDEENMGVIPRAVRQIFRHREEVKNRGWVYSCTVTYCEIYINEIRDLLGSNPKLNHEIRMVRAASGGKTKTIVDGLSSHPVNSFSELMQLLPIAKHNRATASTDSNARSSRSHSVFTMTIVGNHHESGTTSVGLLNLIDLAGSERLVKSKVTGKRKEETIAINKTLTCLGDVIAAKAKNKKHVPFRNSKLTHMLQDSFEDGSKTLMFINLAAEPEHEHESLCSLRFGAKAHESHVGKAKKNIE